MRRLLPLAVLPFAVACSSTVNTTDASPADAPPGDTVVALDGGPGPDANPTDGGPSTDEGAPDGGPTRDLPDPIDVFFPGDTGAPPTDTGRPPGDAPRTPVMGRWRVVGWQGPPDARGARITLTDRNAPYTDPASGIVTQVRANGVLHLEEGRLGLTFGTLAGDHFYVYDHTRTLAEGYSATGFTAPGLLDDDAGTFTATGGAMVSFDRHADGTISLADRMAGTTVTFARAPSAPTRATINAVGAAQLHRPMLSAPLARPRVALFWDRPGAMPFVETNGYALMFGVGGYAAYPLVLAGPPDASVRAVVGGAPVALAFIVVYDDVNNNTRLDAGVDVTRGLSPVGIVWRGEGTPSPEFARSPFRDTAEGYQLVHYRADASTGSLGFVPFDTTVPVSPDVPVATVPLMGPSPDVIR